MNKEKMKMEKMTERILNHALQIIYLLTGEEYTIVKKNSPHSSIHQLTGEAPIKCDDVTVCFSMEEWDYIEGHKDLYKDVETQQTLKTLGFPGTRVSGLHGENLDNMSINVEQEGEMDEKAIQKVKIHSDPCPELQEETPYPEGYETDDRDSQQMKIHSNVYAGPSTLKSSIFSNLEEVVELNVKAHQQVKEEEIPINISERLQDDNLHIVSINKEGQYERGRKEIQQVAIHSDICAGGSMQRIATEHHKPQTSKPFVIEDKSITKIYEGASHADTLCKNGSKAEVTAAKVFAHGDSGKSLSQHQNLVRHQRSHIVEKPFVCIQCGKCFNQKSSLIIHQRVHTRERPFVCPQCGKCFSQKATLVQHQRIHTLQKPFACSECGKCFSQKSALFKHQRIHTGEKPFACSLCGKCYSQQSDLVNHQRIHTGEKPFACSECGKCFSRKSVLVRHQSYHRAKYKKFHIREKGLE